MMTEIERRECVLIQTAHALAETSLKPLTAGTGAAMAELAGQVLAIGKLPMNSEERAT